MSSEVLTLEEQMTGFVVTGLDGMLRVSLDPKKIDLNVVLKTANIIGSGEYRNAPLIAGNPTVYSSPEEKVGGWPCRLFKVGVPAGALGLKLEDGGLMVSQATVISEENSLLCLGPQHEELVTMAGQLLDITQEQQERMSDIAGPWMEQAAIANAVRGTAALAGRNNSGAVTGLMWTNQGVWARMPIGHAALAVAHRDLLGDIQLAEDYESLYRPWREVMGEPAV